MRECGEFIAKTELVNALLDCRPFVAIILFLGFFVQIISIGCCQLQVDIVITATDDLTQQSTKHDIIYYCEN